MSKKTDSGDKGQTPSPDKQKEAERRDKQKFSGKGTEVKK